MRITVLVLLAIALAAAALGQSATSTGAIQGSVLDQTGAAVPGTIVTLTGIGSGAARKVSTDGQGNFILTGLPVGDYILSEMQILWSHVRCKQLGYLPAMLS